MGLGALFFLALAYATETGWYASVKRIIEAVAGYLPYGMGLMGLVLLIITLMDGAHVYQWMDPEVVAMMILYKVKQLILIQYSFGFEPLFTLQFILSSCAVLKRDP
jgi:type IV secretory pathway VirB2 component (pilin)